MQILRFLQHRAPGGHGTKLFVKSSCGCCFSFFGRTRDTWKFPGQGLNLSHSCDLPTGVTYLAHSLTRCARLGIKPATPQRKMGW